MAKKIYLSDCMMDALHLLFFPEMNTYPAGIFRGDCLVTDLLTGATSGTEVMSAPVI